MAKHEHPPSTTFLPPSWQSVVTSQPWRWLCYGLLPPILLLERLTPLGFSHGDLYLLPLLLAAFSRSESLLKRIALLGILFTVVGFFLSPPGIALGFVLSNRLLSILLILIVALLSIHLWRQVHVREEVREQLQTSKNQLEAQHERYQYLARATADAVWDWDLQADETWWNHSLQTLFGHSPESLVKDWMRWVHPGDRPGVKDSLREALDGNGQHWKADFRFLRRDGSCAYVSNNGFILRDDSGKPLRMVGGMVDISQTRLLQERLMQAQRMEAIGQLTGGVAHDFNNLLTVIQGNCELAAESLLPEHEAKPLLDMVQQAVESASRLTGQLLAFSRRQPLEPQSIDVKALILNMEPLLHRTLREDIEIELVHGAGLWTAEVDGGQLESTLLNLCLNARDAMPAGGRLTIETSNTHLSQEYADEHAEVLPGQYVMIAVSDTGCGISPEALSSVFEPFYTTKEPGKGTGLGLSMVYGFVKQSRGHIKAYSEPEQGSTFRLYLPRGSELRSVPARPSPGLLKGSECILLVEDDELVRHFAHQTLEGLGYQVLSAENGPRALQILSTDGEQIDLLFTDVIMPGGINGRQLADQARALHPHLKVLYTSGYTENAIIHQGRLDPGVHLLSKPYHRRELASKLRQILEAEAPLTEGVGDKA